MKILLALALSLTLSSCGPLTAASSLLGGGDGPKVNANLQVGKENKQAVVDNSSKVEGENVQVETNGFKSEGMVESVKIMNQDIPMYIIFLLILGWLLPSPQEIWNELLRVITLGRFKR